MKKKILFVINTLDGGGAEKSLVSLLHELEKYKHEYSIDLLIPYEKGLFYNQIPEYVHKVNISDALYYMSHPVRDLLKDKKLNPKFWLKKIQWIIKQKRLNGVSSGIREQALWALWKKTIPEIDEFYDIAISYLNGYPNYFVIDKVNARKKILWIHNEYQRIGYDSIYDESYYRDADEIVTISDSCVESFMEVFPQYSNKISVLENISSGKLIHHLADEDILDDEFKAYEGYKILSIGRLVKQKNFRLAIESAKILRDRMVGIDFKWFIMGKGQLEDELRAIVKQYDLQDTIRFLGVRANPYPYIKQADVFVQTSLFEGKSIVVDEAKILQKPIVCTNYTTVRNSLENGVTGLIVDMDASSISDAIERVLNDESLQKMLAQNLQVFSTGNSNELTKYIGVFENEDT